MVQVNLLAHTVLGWLIVMTIAFPTNPSLMIKGLKGTSSSNATLSKRNVPLFGFYANATAAVHQTEFDIFSANGYRMISLSVYGQPPEQLYAAIWVERSGPAYFAIHEASDSTYQSFFDAHAPNGFVSTFITATGPFGSAIFAGVMEQNGVTNWYQLCDLTTDQYESELNTGVSNGYILKSFTEYGTSSDRRYCGVWYHNDQNAPFNTFVDETYTNYQLTFNSQTASPGWRPGYLSLSEDHLISSEFVNTNVGSWVAMHGITWPDLFSESSTQLAAGRYPIHLQGGGTGENINFAVIFAQQDIPI